MDEPRPVLVATDLDQTLIFSPRATTRLGGGLAAFVVEAIDGRVISEMAHSVADALRALHPSVAFVPTTTRTAAQLAKLTLPVTPRFAVAASGGVVLEHGAPDQRWSALMAQRLTACAPVAQVRALLDKQVASGALLRTHTADKLFCYAIVDSAVFTPERLAAISGACTTMSWRTVHQGRKLYVLPNALHKAHAVSYLRDRLALEKGQPPMVLAAGDTILDWELLTGADHGWIPAGSELANAGLDTSSVTVTVAAGHTAALEIVTAWREAASDAFLAGHLRPAAHFIPQP